MKYKCWRLPYYEDDVVEYTSHGKYPKIPDRYKTHTIRKQPYKAFINRECAERSLSYSILTKEYPYTRRRISPEEANFVVFQCKKCGLWHIMHKSNYAKCADWISMENVQNSTF